MAIFNAMAARDSEFFDALERVGFKVDRFGDLIYHLYHLFGGHYQDVGTSKKIADGLVRNSPLFPFTIKQQLLPTLSLLSVWFRAVNEILTRKDQLTYSLTSVGQGEIRCSPLSLYTHWPRLQ
jgi:hypothetical protein